MAGRWWAVVVAWGTVFFVFLYIEVRKMWAVVVAGKKKKNSAGSISSQNAPESAGEPVECLSATK